MENLVAYECEKETSFISLHYDKSKRQWYYRSRLGKCKIQPREARAWLIGARKINELNKHFKKTTLSTVEVATILVETVQDVISLAKKGSLGSYEYSKELKYTFTVHGIEIFVKRRIEMKYSNKRGRPATKDRSVIDRMKSSCSRCGWEECTCDIHHINGKKIVDPDCIFNLCILCPNCHREFHRGLIKKEDLVSIGDRCCYEGEHF